jgi:hypothetical protein
MRLSAAFRRLGTVLVLHPIWAAAVLAGYVSALLVRARLLEPVEDDPEERPHDPEKMALSWIAVMMVIFACAVGGASSQAPAFSVP